MADQSNSNAPTLPPLKTYAVQNGDYVYLYPGHYKTKANGRTCFIKGPKSAARLKPVDGSKKYLVVWQDWFLEEMPELMAYNVYYEEESSSKFSTAPQPSFSFTAKSGSEHTNSMSCQQYYEAGSTWALDQLLHNTPLIFSINSKYLKDRLTPEVIALTYYIALTDNTNFADYRSFSSRTRLSTQEPFTAEDIAAFMRSISSSNQVNFWSELYNRFHKEFSNSSDFWVIDTEYPHHILERLSEGAEIPCLEQSKELKSLVSRFKRKVLFKDTNAEYSYHRILQQQPSRIMTVMNIKNGQACNFTLYNNDQFSSTDIVTFMQDFPLWQNRPVFEANTDLFDEQENLVSNDDTHSLLTDEQLSPKMRTMLSPFVVGSAAVPAVQPLYPSNLNMERTTVVINNNLDNKSSSEKFLSRPVSGIVPPLFISNPNETSDQASSLGKSKEVLTKEQAEDLASLRFASEERLQSKDRSTFEELTSQLKTVDKIVGTQQPTPLHQRVNKDEQVNNEQVTNINVTKLQAKHSPKSALQQAKAQVRENADSNLGQVPAQELQSTPETSFGTKQSKHHTSHGVFVTDRFAHIADQFDFYQKQHLPFFLQVLSDTDLYNMCIDKFIEELVKPTVYSSKLNRSNLSINLFEDPEEYSEILNLIKNGQASDPKKTESNQDETESSSGSEAEIRLKHNRTSVFGSLFDDDSASFVSRRSKSNASAQSSGTSDHKESKQEAQDVDKSDTKRKGGVSIKSLFQSEDSNKASPLTLHICLDFRELFKLANTLDTLSSIDHSDTFVDRSEIEEAIHNRINDYKVKKDIVERASGRVFKKPRYSLTKDQMNLAFTLEDLLQKRNHVLDPDVAKMQREAKAKNTLDPQEAEFILTPPTITKWTVERELKLQSMIKLLLTSRLPRSVLKISITNSMHKIDDALLACNMLQTQEQMYERMAEDVLNQERFANNQIIERLLNNDRDLEYKGKQFLWFLALNMKFMLNVRMESSNRNSKYMLLLKKDICTIDELLDQLCLITASRKESGLEYARSMNSKQQLMLLSFLDIQVPSNEAYTSYNQPADVPLMPDVVK